MFQMAGMDPSGLSIQGISSVMSVLGVNKQDECMLKVLTLYQRMRKEDGN